MYKTIISFRNSGVSIAVSGPGMERKLNRTRKMSENIQRVESKTMTTIPTQKEDITIKWIHMIINQNLLKSGKAPLDQEAIEGMTFEIIDCKSRYAILYFYIYAMQPTIVLIQLELYSYFWTSFSQ